MEGLTMLNYDLLCNEKVNYNPLVLSYALFYPVKHKTDIVGYWKDKDGKLYQDNIELRRYSPIFKDAMNYHKKELFAKGEICIAYKNVYNELIIEYPNNDETFTLKHRTAIIEDNFPSDDYISLLLDNAEGLTIYSVDNGQYLIEIYH